MNLEEKISETKIIQEKIQESIQQLEIYKKEYDEVLKELEKELENKESNIWKPDIEDEFYFIDCDGEVESTSWQGICFDTMCFNIGNCFKARKEAEFMTERLRVIQELKQFAGSFEPGIENIYLSWDSNVEDLFLYPSYSKKLGEICFSNTEKAHEAIETIGKERIRKYYLLVEEE